MRVFPLGICAVIASLCAVAQVAPVTGGETQLPLVISRGKAVVEAAPDYAEFWLEYAAEASTAQEAVARLADAEQTVSAAFEEEGVAPPEIEATGIIVENIQMPRAAAEVRVRFPLPAGNNAAQAADALAAASDAAAAVAERTQAGDIMGPELGVEDRGSVERAAVGQAMAEAYPAAEAAANAMRAQPARITEASVERVTWGTQDAPHDERPTTRRLTCAAVVRVTYRTGPL
jgi:uncharacterized protein YggE